MKTLSRLILHEHGIEQSNFINKKAQTEILGGRIFVVCRCGFYGDFLTDCFVCENNFSFETCLEESQMLCEGTGSTCTADPENYTLIGC